MAPPPTAVQLANQAEDLERAKSYIARRGLNGKTIMPAPTDTLNVLLAEVAGVGRAVSHEHAKRAALLDRVRLYVLAMAETGTPNDPAITHAGGAAGVAEMHNEARTGVPQNTAWKTARQQHIWSPQQAAIEGLVAEIACLERVSDETARALLFESDMLMHGLPRTLQALSDGVISYRHAQIIIDQAASLPESVWAEFEQRILDQIEGLTPGQLREKTIRLRELLHPESIAMRRKKALKDRWMRLTPAPDGMSYLEMYVTSEDASAIYNRITDVATSLKKAQPAAKAEAEATDRANAIPEAVIATPSADIDPNKRTLRQLQADVATDLLLMGVTATGLGHGVRATVNVTVPVLSLMGLTEEPANLEGVGPIDPETARRLAGTATRFTRLLVHPETGVLLSVGRDSYRVPAELKRALQARDETCRFPGCNRPARGGEVDHTHDWQFGGETALNNLAIFCLRGHRLKHQTAWKVKQRKNGTLEWTSPAGRVTATHPATRTKPVLPEGYDLPVRAEGVRAEGVHASGGPRFSMDELWNMADRSDGNDAPF